jgi:hypothetical protein
MGSIHVYHMGIGMVSLSFMCFDLSHAVAHWGELLCAGPVMLQAFQLQFWLCCKYTGEGRQHNKENTRIQQGPCPRLQVKHVGYVSEAQVTCFTL